MKRILLFTGAVFFWMASSVWASSYSGSLAFNNGLTATEAWQDATFSWEVFSPGDPAGYPSFWEYSYTWQDGGSGNSLREISHLILEVSVDFLSDNIKAGTTDETDLNVKERAGPEWFASTDNSGSNPGMPDTNLENGGLGPGDIFGIEWGTDNDPTTLAIIIITDRAPMWGDFYAKDGEYSGQKQYAYNSMFGSDTNAPIGNGNNGGWVLVPDTTVVPIPSAVWLLSSGLIGLVGLRRKFRER